jgi:hypothetical protein
VEFIPVMAQDDFARAAPLIEQAAKKYRCLVAGQITPLRRRLARRAQRGVIPAPGQAVP